MTPYRIATIPGDGIGKDVVPAKRQVLQALPPASLGFGFHNVWWRGARDRVLLAG